MRRTFCSVLLLMLSLRLEADVTFLQPAADATLIAIAPDNNLGVAEFFNAGINGRNYENRGLFSFDLSRIPAGSTITKASLTLEVIREPAEFSTPSYFAFYRVLRPWGEGTKTHEGTPGLPLSPGQGSPATAGDVTWNDRFYGMSSPWAAPGGAAGIDFSPLISAEVAIAGLYDSPYTLTADPGLQADVQYWIDHPRENFGWMMITEAADHNTARSFASREDPLGRGPLLEVDFTPVPEPSFLMLLSTSAAVLFGVARFRRR
jgi:hypothetical protein